MSSIDLETIKKVAFLSRIHVEEEKLESFTDKLSNIFDWIEKLQEVDVEGVEPLASIIDENQRMRQDVVNDGAYPEKVLSNAKDVAHGYYTVPKVVE